MRLEYAIEILKHELRKEKSYLSNHKSQLKRNPLNVSDKRVFEMSVRLAQNRIPQLESAIEKLSC
jgi:hypothetical protein